MIQYILDEAILLKKTTLKDNTVLLSLFSKENGKISVFAYGVKKITSRRISHLETGNYIKFNFRAVDDIYTLRETELVWGFSNIRGNLDKTRILFDVFAIVSKLLPEGQSEKEIFHLLVKFLTKLNSKPITIAQSEDLLIKICINLGFFDKKTTENPSFDLHIFLSELTGFSYDKSYFT